LEVGGESAELRLFVKRADSSAPLVAPEKEIEKEKEEEKEEASSPQRNDSQPATVPLSDIIDENVLKHPFFSTLKDDFLEFARNVRESVPPRFPEQVRTQFETALRDIHGSIEIGVENLRQGIRVPETWRSIPLVAQVNQAIQDGRESIQSRMDRWNASRQKLIEMGFTEYAFIQKMLILQHDGDVQRVVDDLLVRQGQADSINNTFGSLSQSIVQFFRTVGLYFQTQSNAALRGSSDAVMSLGGRVNEGLQASAQYVQHHIDNNRERIDHLQSELDRNVQALQQRVQQLNNAGATVGSHLNSGLQQSLALINEAISRSNALSQSVQSQANQAGESVSLHTLRLLSDSIRHLGGLFLQASNNMSHQGVTLNCSICNAPIVGVRYLCASCPHVNICEQCEMKPDAHDPAHVLLKIRPQAHLPHGEEQVSPCSTGMTGAESSCSSEGATGPSGATGAEDLKVEDFEVISKAQQSEAPIHLTPERSLSPIPAPVPAPAPPPALSPSPVCSSPSVDPRYAPFVASLKEMGFDDEERVVALLAAHNCNMEEVLNVLLNSCEGGGRVEVWVCVCVK
jgi:hypothetical protein